MAQNTSHAVMAQRREPPDSLDYFPTPPWATRALCEFLPRAGIPFVPGAFSVWEPACGEGHMARPLSEYFRRVKASDVHDYGFGDVEDFLFPAPLQPYGLQPNWIITNPPFRLAVEFAFTALPRARDGVALLVRTAFLEGGGRYERLFQPHPPAWVLQFAERVPMHRGRLEENGSTATAYCWIVWRVLKGRGDTLFGWIPPCRRRMERPGDYAEPAP